MDWYMFRQRLLADHAGNPQNSHTLSLALDEIEQGLRVLARFGHVFHLATGTAPAIEAFPRKIFHVSIAPLGRVVWSQSEIDELGDEWYDSVQEAQHSSGLRAQLAGRGGIGTRALPAVIPDAPKASDQTKRPHFSNGS
jgi:hypothetical protein